MLEAWFARQAAEKAKKEKEAAEAESDALQADAKGAEDRVIGEQQTAQGGKGRQR